MGLPGRLERALVLRGWTLKQLAEAIKVDTGAVSRWLAGDRVPGGEWLMKLPGALRVSGHWLLTGEPPEEPPQVPATYQTGYGAGWAACAAAVTEALVPPDRAEPTGATPVPPAPDATGDRAGRAIVKATKARRGKSGQPPDATRPKKAG